MTRGEVVEPQTLPPLLSVIIPTLNEADHLPALLADLQRQEAVALEIIIGDGGSTDETEAIAQASGAHVVRCRRGRGAQMNGAAEAARGAFLLFLHADSRLEDPDLLSRALSVLQQAEQQQPGAAGHFRLRFLRASKKNALAYRYLEEKTSLNRPGTANGDQGLLLSADFFRLLGGFDESLPFLEDQRIGGKIWSHGRWLTLPGHLATSARRFESEGFHRRYLLMGIMVGLSSIGEQAFFSRAPGIYRVQEATGALLLSPFFGLLWRMIRQDWGMAGTGRVFYRLGRVIRQNAWQFFFFFDVCLRPLLGPDRYPLLAVHDRFVAPCLDFRLCNGLVGLFCFLWYMTILAPFFWLREALSGKTA